MTPCKRFRVCGLFCCSDPSTLVRFSKSGLMGNKYEGHEFRLTQFALPKFTMYQRQLEKSSCGPENVLSFNNRSDLPHSIAVSLLLGVLPVGFLYLVHLHLWAGNNFVTVFDMPRLL